MKVYTAFIYLMGSQVWNYSPAIKVDSEWRKLDNGRALTGSTDGVVKWRISCQRSSRRPKDELVHSLVHGVFLNQIELLSLHNFDTFKSDLQRISGSR